MNDIVTDLQMKALDDNTNLSSLLRMALFAAQKLDAKDSIDWINNELNGYSQSTFNQVPEYRKTRASLFGNHPYQGWKPIPIENREYEDLVLTVIISQSIHEIEQLKLSQGELHFPFTGEQEIQLHTAIGMAVDIKRIVPRVALDKICNAVRNTILQWALTLEKQGITGKGMSFTPDEKRIAQKNQIIHIKNFTGNLGNISNSQVTQEFNVTIEENNFDTLRDYLLDQGLDPADIANLQIALKDDPSPTAPHRFGEKVSAWIGAMTSKAVTGTLAIGLDVVAGVLANAISKYYGFN